MSKNPTFISGGKVIEDIVVVSHDKSMVGGGLEGAERMERETALWSPSMRSPDQIINSSKPLADARTRDMIQNDGYAAGASTLHKDNIVGSQYRLNANPNWKLLGVSQDWADEFQQVVESRFTTIAESDNCYFDASGHNTFTGLVRLAVGGFVLTGEVLGTAEWLRNVNRPIKTAIQLISPDRLSNPMGMSDTRNLRRGINIDDRGRPVSYWFRKGHPSETYDLNAFQWKEVQAEKPWGRKQVIHIIEQLLPDQSRGVADMVAALKNMKMTKKFQDITLQNAVINASFAAAIESELPSGEVFATLGANNPNGVIGGMNDYLSNYLGALGSYLDGAKNIQMDGAKIPHLFPGTKLNMQPVGTPGGVGTGFEQSLLRHTAATLGLSYEQFSRDYTQTNYSSARASMNETFKFMQARKTSVADRFASSVYRLWLEEEIANGNLPLPVGKDRSWFYEPLVKDAISRCTWIGASRGQIDEMKETQAALMRINGGLSTFEKECSKLGDDFRDIFEQRNRENKLMDSLGLEFSADTQKTNTQNQDTTNGGKTSSDNTTKSGGNNE